MTVSQGKAPWTLDASGDFITHTGPVKIVKLVFRNESGAAADLEVLDSASGRVVARFEAVANGDSESETFPEPQWFDGVGVDTMPTSSVLYVYPATVNVAGYVPGMKEK